MRSDTSEEISGDGGKSTLLALHEYLLRSNSLLTSPPRKPFAVMFYLDKDIDDIEQKTITSDHVVYTEAYEMENLLFMHGDLCKAMSSAASLDFESVEKRVPDQIKWRTKVAQTWREWVELCVFFKTYNIGAGGGYSANTSLIHRGPYSKLRVLEYRKRIKACKRELGLRGLEFESEFNRTRAFIESVYSGGKSDSVFKGKWYPQFAAHDTKIAGGKRRIDMKHAEEKITNALLSSINFEEEAFSYFRVPLEALIRRLIISPPNS